MINDDQVKKLRQVITESLRVQRGDKTIDYVDAGRAMEDACAKQNHAIFARRGSGKTLLLHHSSRILEEGMKSVYLNCEDFKRHSFPNVLIEILSALFRELDKHLLGWFGKKKKSKQIIRAIISKLKNLQRTADIREEQIKQTTSTEIRNEAGGSAGADIGQVKIELDARSIAGEREEVERSFAVHQKKLEELDRWLPELKENIRTFFDLSKKTSCVLLQIDDLYHLRREDQVFVVDYIHRLCKDVPLFFKIATLRHVSTLYADRGGQPIGAQERHDYQSINIDYTFGNFKETADQNWKILLQFGKKANVTKLEIGSIFKGEGFNRLVMAGGGVPRDVLSLFLQALSDAISHKAKIGKDEVRILSRTNFERKIEELKQDSKDEEQDDLLKGIYIIRKFCLERKINVFAVQERMLQQNPQWRALFLRLLDYRIIHNCAVALTHKSQEGTYQAFSIDIGSHAHLRKLHNKFTEVDISADDLKERLRSAPVLDEKDLSALFATVPKDVEAELLNEEAE